MGEWKRERGEVRDVMATGGRVLQDERYILYSQCVYIFYESH